MSSRHYRNEHVAKWLRALSSNGGHLLVAAHEQPKLGLYHLGALWAKERGYIVDHGTADIISDRPRRFAYSLTPRGSRALQAIRTHEWRYDHFRAGMICDKCGSFVSDFA